MANSPVTVCEVCGNGSLDPVLDLGGHPMCDDLVPIGDTRVCKQYPIEILYCAKCATAHQRFQVPKTELFPASYHYRSRFTADVLKGMSALADSCEQRLSGLADRTVLDVGCNDGSLLDFFRAKGARTIGIEPTNACSDAEGHGHELLQRFFDRDSAREVRQRFGVPDVITFTNVFAHIENLGEVLDALRILMGPTSALVVENHYLGAVFDRYQFDTFYHEHPRTYSLNSFVHIAKSLGRNLSGVEFPARYGGNIRVFIGGPAAGADAVAGVAEVLAREVAFRKGFDELRQGMQRWRIAAAERIDRLRAGTGAISGKAFPGRAAILVKLLKLDVDRLDRVFEKPGSMKIGHYLPGTRIPIVSDDDFLRQPAPPPVLLNLAWHIASEIEQYLNSLGYRGTIAHIVEPNDFAH